MWQSSDYYQPQMLGAPQAAARRHLFSLRRCKNVAEIYGLLDGRIW
jgi:hypothetical protein